MNLQRKANTEIILAHLKGLPAGATFTAAGIALALEAVGVTRGSVSGFLSRLLREHRIEIVERKRGAAGKMTHSFVVKDLSAMETKGGNFPGGARGRTASGRTSTEKIADLLLQIASEITELRTPLEHYETRELMKELARRLES